MYTGYSIYTICIYLQFNKLLNDTIMAGDPAGKTVFFPQIKLDPGDTNVDRLPYVLYYFMWLINLHDRVLIYLKYMSVDSSSAIQCVCCMSRYYLKTGVKIYSLESI